MTPHCGSTWLLLSIILLARNINRKDGQEMLKEVKYLTSAARHIGVMILASGALLVGCSTATAGLTDDFKEREEINRNYQLAPGATVEVSSIRGPVEILNTDSATAEVQIIRTARTREDLEYHKVEIEQVGNSLVVRGVQEPRDRRADRVYVNHHVKIKLPKRVDLVVNSISGWVRIADVDGHTKLDSISGSATIGNVGGPLQVRSISGELQVGNVGAETRVTTISGNVRLGEVNASLDVFSVTGNVKATVYKLDTQGIHIKSVTGSVEIVLKGEVNADFDAQGFTGHVYLDLPDVIRDSDSEERSKVRARIGAGGSPITVYSVSGNIRLARS